jgi:hypothetical protein
MVRVHILRTLVTICEQITLQPRFCHAVWVEGTKTIADTIPVCWIDSENSRVLWPRNPTKAITEHIQECTQPENLWLSFHLKKIKRYSSKFN